jgi:hypothetical protein
MAYGHAGRSLALIRRLEADARHLLASTDQPDAEEPARLREREAGTDAPRTAAEASPLCLDAHG